MTKKAKRRKQLKRDMDRLRLSQAHHIRSYIHNVRELSDDDDGSVEMTQSKATHTETGVTTESKAAFVIPTMTTPDGMSNIDSLCDDIEAKFKIQKSNTLSHLSVNTLSTININDDEKIKELKSIGSLVVGTPGNLGADEFIIEGDSDSDQQQKHYKITDGGD